MKKSKLKWDKNRWNTNQRENLSRCPHLYLFLKFNEETEWGQELYSIAEQHSRGEFLTNAQVEYFIRWFKNCRRAHHIAQRSRHNG